MQEGEINYQKYRPDIHGLRALAVLSVVFFHAFPFWVTGGFVGVDVFFVISGFLITGIILSNLSKGTFSFFAFYSARVRRIFPALLLVLITCLVIGWSILLTDEYKQLGKHVAGGAGFVSNFILWNESGYFDTASEAKPLLHLWSLGIEEQFYILWPFILWGVFKLRWGVAAFLFFIAGASFATNLAIAPTEGVADFYSPLSRFWELMVGAALAWHGSSFKPRALRSAISAAEGNRGWRSVLAAIRNNDVVLRDLKSVCGVFLIVTAVFGFNRNMSFPDWRALLPTVGAALLISAGPHAVTNRLILSQRLLVWIGLISYPLYLWHWPLLSFAHIIVDETPSRVTRIVIILISILLAWLTYRVIEKPIRFGIHRARAAFILCLLMLVVGGSGYDIFVRDGLQFREIVKTNEHIRDFYAINAKIRERYYTLFPCDMDDGIVPQKIKRFCTQYGSSDAPNTIVIWGDSHSGEGLSAGAWSPVFYELAREQGNTRVIRFSHPGCPPLIGVRRSDGSGNAYNCSDITQGQSIVEAIKKLNPSYIVLISHWSLYINGMRSPDGVLAQDTHLITTSLNGDATMQTGEAALQETFLPTIQALSQISNVLILKNFPVLLKPVKTALAVRLSWYHDNSFVKVEPTVARHLKLSELPYRLIDEAAKLPNVKVFDPTPLLCTDFCAYIKNKVVMYSDDNHPTEEGALQFKDNVQELMQLSVQNPPTHVDEHP